MACGLCLLVAPALLLVASIVNPASGSGDDDRKYLKSLADDPDATELSTALFMVGFALMVIAIVGLVHVIRERGVTLANIGGALAIIGSIFFVALQVPTIADLNTVEHVGLDTAEKLNDDVDDYWSAYVVFVPALLGTALGYILLGAAVIRSRIAHLAAGILIIVGLVLIPLTEGMFVAFLFLLAGFGMVGLKILGMKDEEWDGRVPPAVSPPAA